MDEQRKTYLDKARICLEQAEHEPARRQHWLQQAEDWTRRASELVREDGDDATYEVHDRRLIPKSPRRN
ncbi:hypothetical protein [Bradyrhizobium sp. CCBAU 53338]|uniref:hypothetical protein n=1 Tax=Bradyrhizobium sp. CCBAU 53338 TaxID=1325111 RepID=UPI00188B8EB3|nr:hypothetical protein [Bradyrhizobium sp. CCBAU 53338]